MDSVGMCGYNDVFYQAPTLHQHRTPFLCLTDHPVKARFLLEARLFISRDSSNSSPAILKSKATQTRKSFFFFHPWLSTSHTQAWQNRQIRRHSPSHLGRAAALWHSDHEYWQGIQQEGPAAHFTMSAHIVNLIHFSTPDEHLTNLPSGDGLSKRFIFTLLLQNHTV